MFTAMVHTLIRAGNSGLMLGIMVFRPHLHSLIQAVEFGSVLVS
jgi:hypothetical protein